MSDFVDHLHVIDVQEVFVAEVILLSVVSLTFPFGVDVQEHQMVGHALLGESTTDEIDLLDLLNRRDESTEQRWVKERFQSLEGLTGLDS